MSLQDLVFAILIANGQLITLVRLKKCFMHPVDLHIIFNLITASDSFKHAESWTPICLPKFDSTSVVLIITACSLVVLDGEVIMQLDWSVLGMYRISGSGWPDIQPFFTLRLRFQPNCRQILDILGSRCSLPV